MVKEKVDLFGLSLEEVKQVCVDLGLASFRSKQICEWLYKKHVWDFSRMSNIAQKDIQLLEEHCTLLPNDVKVLLQQKSADKCTDKLLLELVDGNAIETVGMKHKYGNSVCISSQVGCAMQCEFCASTVNGLQRNLTAQEMLLQVALFQKQFAQTCGHVGNVVIMGSGEPLLNYDSVLEFLHLVHNPVIYNLGFRNITLSTCGIINGIEKLAQENLPISLAISLHAPFDGLRSELMPINDKYKISDVVRAASEYAQKTGRQVTYEYLLIKNVNDSIDMAKELANLLKNKLFAVNIIPINEVAHKNWQKPSKNEVDLFVSILKKAGVPTTIRKEMGKDIKAACGQLKAGYLDGQLR